MRETLNILLERYKSIKNSEYQINMERGWPCKEQLDISMPMLDIISSNTRLEREVDYRGYAGTAGIEPLKQLFAEALGVASYEIYIGGTMSTTLMYDIINKAVLFGFHGHEPWINQKGIKFICPVPGYEKHFKICETFNIEMIPVSMDATGPDMDEIEKIVKSDEKVKGIWCVPLYSNPTGAIYSDVTVERLASMKTKAEDFRIFWDNAYFAHHLTDKKYTILNIIQKCKEYGNTNRVFEFASTSKITFPGGGIGICASSKENIEWITKNSLLQLKSGDKINQFRHFLFLKDMNGLEHHMKKHREIIGPKFDAVDHILQEELKEWDIATWEKPKGGYFFNIKLVPGMADEVWQMCKNMGVMITPAGSTFPYGKDPEDSYLRIAPTYPDMEELRIAIQALAVAIKIVGERKGY